MLIFKQAEFSENLKNIEPQTKYLYSYIKKHVAQSYSTAIDQFTLTISLYENCME